MTLSRNGFIEIEGFRLHYLEWGEESAATMVLVHGLGECARSWDRFAGAMAADRRVIALDLRGHGDSQWAPSGAYSLQDYMSDLEALVEQMGLERILLIGHSEGGRTGTAYMTENPELVEALIVVDSDLAAITAVLPDGTTQGTNDKRQPGYEGICPALIIRPYSTVGTRFQTLRGPHRLEVRIYALDIELGLSPGVTKVDLEVAMEDHILGEAKTMGKFQPPVTNMEQLQVFVTRTAEAQQATSTSTP